MTITHIPTDLIADPAFAGTVNLDNFTEEEIAKLRTIHRRVVRLKAKEAFDRVEQVAQENLVLKRLLLAARAHIPDTEQNQILLSQIDHQVRR